MSAPASTPERILFVELLGGIGDLLIALPAIGSLARSRPLAELDVLTFEPGAQLLLGHPDVRRVTSPEELLGVRDAPGAVARLLDEERYDLVVSDTRYGGIPELIERNAPRAVTDLWRGPRPDQRVGDRFLEILVAEGLVDPRCSTTPPRLEIAEAGAELAAPEGTGPLVFLVPEAGEELKRWPLERFAAVGRELARRHDARVLIPSVGDVSGTARLVAAIGEPALALPPTSLRGFASCLRRAHLVISGDTGPGHLAAAVGVPTLTLFGPTWHERYRPAEPNLALQGDPGCPERVVGNFTVQRCWQDGHCPYEWANCTEDLGVDEVVEAAGELLSHGRQR